MGGVQETKKYGSGVRGGLVKKKKALKKPESVVLRYIRQNDWPLGFGWGRMSKSSALNATGEGKAYSK